MCSGAPAEPAAGAGEAAFRPPAQDYVENSVYRLAETSQLQDRRLEFVLLDSPQLNAFAAPGGIIGVNGGLFIHAQTEAEYASVMARTGSPHSDTSLAASKPSSACSCR